MRRTAPLLATVALVMASLSGCGGDGSGGSSSGPEKIDITISGDSVTLFVGSPFTMPRTSVAGLADDVEVDLDARVRLGELDSALATAGWRYLPERGRHWWSLRYTRG